jgi:hypothetical protein
MPLWPAGCRRVSVRCSYPPSLSPCRFGSGAEGPLERRAWKTPSTGRSVRFSTPRLCPRLLDDRVGPEEEGRGERHAERLSRLRIDDQLERRLLVGQVSGLGAVQDLVHKDGGALAQCARVCPIRQQAPCLGEVSPPARQRYSI